MPRGTRAAKAKKRQIVAKGKVAGKKTRVIAKEAGCKVRHVQRLAQEPATHILIAELMRPYRDELEFIVERSIMAVAQGLIATNGRGKVDHEIRLRAVGRAGELLQLAQGDKPEESTAGLVTWEEFVVMYRRRTEHAAQSR